MCGIVGLWLQNSSKKSFLYEKASLMSDAITHRGPDDAGIWVDEEIGITLGHRRLAVIDISKSGHQPMKSINGRYLISFNGEIYNHLSLRKEIENQNQITYPWKSSSDTETLIEAINTWGIKNTLTKLVGMFAFAIWDRKERKLFLARDRFGEKPLYWGWVNLQDVSGDCFVFTSDLLALKSLNIRQKEINSQALASYFQFGYVASPLCIQDGINQLNPGHLIEIRSPKKQTDVSIKSIEQKWWDLNFRNQANPKISQNELENNINEVEKRLIQSVKLQSEADVPLGTFLSGGIDSTLITTLLQSTSSRSIPTFTISFPDDDSIQKGFDEAPYAKRISEHLKTDHTEIHVSSNDAISIIPELGNIYSEPFADSSQIPTHLICKSVRSSGLKVALTGDGSDELFGGYRRHVIAPKIHKYFKNLPDTIKELVCFSLEQIPVPNEGLIINKKDKLISSIKNSSSLEAIYKELLSIWIDPYQILSNNYKNIFINNLEIPSLDDVNNNSDRIMIADLKNYLNNDILVKVDRASMAVGLETRAPFLDHRVAELSRNIPIEMKIRDGKTKWILRNIIYKYIPKNYIERPKSGFAAPINSWIRGPLKEWTLDMLSEETIKDQGYINPKIVTKFLNQHLTGEYDHSSKIWSILMWQIWINQWKK